MTPLFRASGTDPCAMARPSGWAVRARAGMPSSRVLRLIMELPSIQTAHVAPDRRLRLESRIHSRLLEAACQAIASNGRSPGARYDALNAQSGLAMVSAHDECTDSKR